MQGVRRGSGEDAGEGDRGSGFHGTLPTGEAGEVRLLQKKSPAEAGLLMLPVTGFPTIAARAAPGMTDHMSMSPMPPIPPPGMPPAPPFSSLGSSATMASVVRISAATEAAFCSA